MNYRAGNEKPETAKSVIAKAKTWQGIYRKKFAVFLGIFQTFAKWGDICSALKLAAG